MGLKERIQQDVHAAMKAKEALAVNALRMLLAAVKNREIDQRGPLSDEDVVKVCTSLIKQRQESADLYRQGNRPELASREEAEISLLQAYLPQQLSEAELAGLIDASIRESGGAGVRDMGKVMKILMPKVQGRADGKLVSERVRKQLTGSS